jgi:hypothetical protein
VLHQDSPTYTSGIFFKKTNLFKQYIQLLVYLLDETIHTFFPHKDELI